MPEFALTLPRRFAGCVALAVALGARAAVADVGPTASVVELYLPLCTAGPFDGAQLLALMRVELGAIGVADVRVKGPGHVSAPLSAELLAAIELSAPGCESAAEVTIHVVDRATSKVVERTMSIGDVAFDERPRALAIATAELLQASWAELQLTGSPPPTFSVPPEVRASIVQRLTAPPLLPVVAASRPPPPAATVVPGARRSFVSAEAIARTFPSRNTALLGGMLSVSLPVGDSFTAHAAGNASYGDTRAANGSVRMTAVTGSAGIAAVAGTSTTLEIGPTIHAGYVWASGTPSNSATLGHAHSRFIALGLLSATLRLPAKPLTPVVGLDVGAALASASFLADTTHVAGIAGITVALRLGAALTL
ncbi:MAG TPA: hypothetical protein VHC69_06735 [Polyangiaceae bacterium]|nr:hypothetical protein [Polyangiaceae bacterium]